MNLLAAKLYDPGTAVSKSTASLLAMTAFDTTNLRLAITVPAHGMVLFKIRGGGITGATTIPTIFLGVMNGATVLGRVAAQDFPGTMNATTQTAPLSAEFTVTGLTPGAMNVDLAYGVEVIVASTNIKYGGPNNTTTNDAWGGISFEAWDPQSQTANSVLAVDASGRVDVGKVAGTAQTAKDLGAQLDATVSSRMATYTQPTGFLAATFPTTVASPTNITAASGVALAASQHVIVDSGTVTTLTNLPAITAGWLTATGIAAGALDGKGDWNVGKTGYSLTQSFPANFASLAITVGGAVTAGTVSDKTGYSLSVAPLDAAGTRSAVGLATANLDTQLGSLLPTASYTAPDNTSITAIKAKTDSLTFTVPGKIDANILVVNGVTVTGSGTAGSPWGP